MPIKKKYIDTDVYTEAKKRIRHVLDLFDNVLVAFSGGKDSLAVLSLMEEVYREDGRTDKIKVFFRDEELIPDNVIDFVLEKAKSGKYDFRYYAIPLKSTKFILGKTVEYVQWDKDREWVRNPPDIAITLPEGEYRVFDQYSSDAYVCKDENGSCCILTGVRADESLMRFRSVVNKRNENYINQTKAKGIKLAKPIYDWTERDIFVYYCKSEISYCGIYNEEMWNGSALRVATPLHAESAKHLDKLRSQSPTLYQQIANIFPEVLVQERYWSDFDRGAVINLYPHSFEGIHQYIDDHISDSGQRKLAHKRVKDAEKCRQRTLDNSDNLGGYPILYVFKCVLAGQTKRTIIPKLKPSKDELEYEGIL